jgi:hypothetical protein
MGILDRQQDDNRLEQSVIRSDPGTYVVIHVYLLQRERHVAYLTKGNSKEGSKTRLAAPFEGERAALLYRKGV